MSRGQRAFATGPSNASATQRIRIGTSGYTYFWNPGRPSPFAWYLQQRFSCVEVNASFYRFPTPGWVRTWQQAPPAFLFAVKVHRSLTHYTRLRGKAFDLWTRFIRPLEPLGERVRFWLFQFPERFHVTEANKAAITEFLRQHDLGNRAVLEFREPRWWREQAFVRARGAAFCSVDAPGLPRDFVVSNDVLYLRLHGRTYWYADVYTPRQLAAIFRRVRRVRAAAKWILLNNDEGMLPNGQYLLRLAAEMSE